MKALTLLLVSLAISAPDSQGRELAFNYRGCEQINSGRLRRLLSLELVPDWVLTSSTTDAQAASLQLSQEDCDSGKWQLAVANVGQEPLKTQFILQQNADSSSERIAALWTAEWLSLHREALVSPPEPPKLSTPAVVEAPEPFESQLMDGVRFEVSLLPSLRISPSDGNAYTGLTIGTGFIFGGVLALGGELNFTAEFSNLESSPVFGYPGGAVGVLRQNLHIFGRVNIAQRASISLGLQGGVNYVPAAVPSYDSEDVFGTHFAWVAGALLRGQYRLFSDLSVALDIEGGHHVDSVHLQNFVPGPQFGEPGVNVFRDEQQEVIILDGYYMGAKIGLAYSF